MNHHSFSLSSVIELTARVLGFAALLGLSACGAKLDRTGGESHFLAICDGSCSGSLTCIDQRCTRECSKDTDCSHLSQAVCDTAQALARCVAAETPTKCDGHSVGETWKCDCNTCSCGSDGRVSTTLIACNVPAPKVTCNYNGTQFAAGATWPCSDGCNICGCDSEGKVYASNRACLPNTDCLDENGDSHVVEETWSCGDACHQCTCDEGPKIKIKLIDSPECAPPSSTAVTQSPSTPPSASTPPSPVDMDAGSGSGICNYAGRVFESARFDMWLCGDGCNFCFCQQNGSIAQTGVECQGKTTCTDVDGSKHPLNSSWTCGGDGCSKCTCDAGQKISASPIENCATCSYGGRSYANGATWPHSDGCNTAMCLDGQVLWTEKGCGPATSCIDADGSAHAEGSSWGCGDSCHQCTCEAARIISAVDSGCHDCKVGDKTYSYGDSWQCDCNTCSCEDNARVSSTERLCAKTEICSLPQVAGPCEAAFPSYWYNATTTECEAFTYGGCQGNENRFASREQCETSCKPGF